MDTNTKNIANRIEEITRACMFDTEEESIAYRSRGGVLVDGDGVEVAVSFRSDKLAEFKEEIRQIAGKIVPDRLIGEKGFGGGSWLLLEYDRNGDRWGSVAHGNMLVSLCYALGFLEFAHEWHPDRPISKLLMLLEPEAPFVRFFRIIREPVAKPN